MMNYYHHDNDINANLNLSSSTPLSSIPSSSTPSTLHHNNNIHTNLNPSSSAPSSSTSSTNYHNNNINTYLNSSPPTISLPPPSTFHHNTHNNYLFNNQGVTKSININRIQITESQKHHFVLLNDKHSTTRTYGSLLWNQVKTLERLETQDHVKRSTKEKKDRAVELFAQQYKCSFNCGNDGLIEDKKHNKERNEMTPMGPIFLRRLNQCEITNLYDAGGEGVYFSPGIPTVEVFFLKNTKQLYTMATEEEVEKNIKSFRLPKALLKTSISEQQQKDELSLSSRNTRDSITKMKNCDSLNSTTTTSSSSSRTDHDDTTLSSSLFQNDDTVTMTVDQFFGFLTSDIGVPAIEAWKHIKSKFPQAKVGHSTTSTSISEGDIDADANADANNAGINSNAYVHSYPDTEANSDECGIAVGNDKVKESKSAHPNLRQPQHQVHYHNDIKNTGHIKRRSSSLYWQDMIGEMDLHDQDDAILETLGENLTLDNLDDTIRPSSKRAKEMH